MGGRRWAVLNVACSKFRADVGRSGCHPHVDTPVDNFSLRGLVCFPVFRASRMLAHVTADPPIGVPRTYTQAKIAGPS